MALVIAIEPDLRQAAILKRIVKEKVKADLVVVDTRDAAMEAIARGVPDVLLLTALMSPRDEDELIQHLRSLDGADHLQTHTIPQLASSLEDHPSSKGGGLLRAFRRKKAPEPPASGCDPDLFADEIRTFVRYAAEKKEERRALIETGQLAADAAARSSGPVAPDVKTAAPAGSAWSDPFAWSAPATTPPPEATPAIPTSEPDPWATDYRRAGNATAQEAAPSLELDATAQDAVSSSALDATAHEVVEEPVVPVAEAPVVVAAAEPQPAPDPEAAVDALVTAAVEAVAGLSTSTPPARPAPGSDLDLTHDIRGSRSDPGDSREVTAIVESPEVPQSAAIAEIEVAAAGPGSDLDLTHSVGRSRSDPGVPRSLGPLATWVRFEAAAPRATEKTTTDELRDLMAHLAIPQHIAGVTYASGCRIRRVRVPGGRERRKGAVPGPVILSRRQLAAERQTNA